MMLTSFKVEIYQVFFYGISLEIGLLFLDTFLKKVAIYEKEKLVICSLI